MGRSAVTISTLPNVQVSQQGHDADDDDDDLDDLSCATIQGQALDQVEHQDDDEERDQNPDKN